MENSLVGSVIVLASGFLPIADTPWERTFAILFAVTIGLGLALARDPNRAQFQRRYGWSITSVGILGLFVIATDVVGPSMSGTEAGTAGAPGVTDGQDAAAGLAVESVAFRGTLEYAIASLVPVDLSPEDLMSGRVDLGTMSWYTDQQGAEFETGIATIVLRNRSGSSAVVTDMTAESECNEPANQTYLALYTAGGSDAWASIGINLEQSYPRAKEVAFRGSQSILLETDYFAVNHVSLAPGEQLTLKVFMKAERLACRATLMLSVTSESGVDEVRIDNNGVPFAVTGFTPPVDPAYPFSGYSRLYVNDQAPGRPGVIVWTKEDPQSFQPGEGETE